MKLGGKAELMETRSLTIDTSYRHAIVWRPAADTRIILQKIVRSLKYQPDPRKNSFTDGGRAHYWELWEQFGGRVYPFRLKKDTVKDDKGNPVDVFRIPLGKILRPAAEAHVSFIIPPKPTDKEPFIHARERNGDTTRQLQDHGQYEDKTMWHDVFSEKPKLSQPGKFKIYGEVYELTLAHCVVLRDWLNMFRCFHDFDGKYTAGILPALPGSSKKPLAAPTLRRYEACTFSWDGANHHFKERPFPSRATNVTYPPTDAQEVDRRTQVKVEPTRHTRIVLETKAGPM